MTCKTLTNIRTYWALICLTVAAVTANAQSAMKNIFISAPRDVIATIDSITRGEMVLYNEAGSATHQRICLEARAASTLLLTKRLK